MDVAQDVTITAEDCKSVDGIVLKNITDGANIVVPTSELIVGRVSSKAVKNEKGDVLIEADTLISQEKADLIQDQGISEVEVRSVYTCKLTKGICRRCYGVDLSSHKLINIGEAVGIIAAQSIGEPGTQLTMRTFHTGGVDLRKASNVDVFSKSSGKFSLGSNVQLSRLKTDQDYWVTTIETTAFVTCKKGIIPSMFFHKDLDCLLKLAIL